MRDYLGTFEHLVLLDVMRHGGAAFGLTIADEIEARTGSRPSTGAVYTTLDRLERKGFVSSVIEQGTAERDNRRRRRYRITSEGVEALAATQGAVAAMSRGLRIARRLTTFVLAFVLFGGCLSERALASTPSAQAYLAAALQAMGGRARLQGIRTFEYTALGERQMVEQSERPGGPFYVDWFYQKVVRDLVNRRTSIESSHTASGDAWLTIPYPMPAQTIVFDDDVGAVFDGTHFTYRPHAALEPEDLAFEPERVLFTAAQASDLRSLGDSLIHGVAHHVLAFTWLGSPCKLSLNADTNLPWSIEWKRAYPYQLWLGTWGDVTSRLTYSAWALEPYGVSLPREWTFVRAGLPDRQLTLTSVRINGPIDVNALTIPRDLYKAHHGRSTRLPLDRVPLGYVATSRPAPLAFGITQYPGVNFNVAAIKEPNGIYLLETPVSPGYTQRAIDWAAKTAGTRVLGVISTTADWAHISGVRQAVADGLVVYTLDANVALDRAIVAAPHTLHPDALQLHRRTPRFVPVRGRLALGSGITRFELIPYRGDWGERKMMAYFPAQHLLYTSDLISPDGTGGWFAPQYVRELEQKIAAEHLRVDDIFGMEFPSRVKYATVRASLRTFSNGGRAG